MTASLKKYSILTVFVGRLPSRIRRGVWLKKWNVCTLLCITRLGYVPFAKWFISESFSLGFCYWPCVVYFDSTTPPFLVLYLGLFREIIKLTAGLEADLNSTLLFEQATLKFGLHRIHYLHVFPLFYDLVCKQLIHALAQPLPRCIRQMGIELLAL